MIGPCSVEGCNRQGVVEVNGLSYCAQHLDKAMRGAPQPVKSAIRMLVEKGGRR